ncbi:MAG: hypothetical protein GX362_04875 [Methanosarcinaceae archaeon]|nr:hypothetical protein [Methanosarcinaceae archaeon]
MYIIICLFAYFSMIYLTLRDLRIFWRTGFKSYRNGAFRGLVASTFALAGVLLLAFTGNILLGLLLVFIGLLVNKKEEREEVFTNASAIDRFLGKTDLVRPELKNKETGIKK